MAAPQPGTGQHEKSCHHPTEEIVTRKNFWSVLLVVALSSAVATPARAGTLSNDAHNIEVGIVVAAVAVVVVVILVIHHEAVKGKTITGCVSSGVNGMTITDQKNQRVYALLGNTAGIAPGERLKLHGWKLNPQGTDTMPGWEATGVVKDLGVCHP
jgi:hypothetical protein